MTERFRNEFVEFVPDSLEEGVLYVSMRYRTVSHLCPCGCRQEVPLSISPTAWKLTFNGEVTLSPSVGNWSFPCRSHYFIREGRVCWAGDMSDAAVEHGRAHVASKKANYYGEHSASNHEHEQSMKNKLPEPAGKGEGVLEWFKRLFR